MTLAVLKSRALTGMAAPEVTVEVHLANGLPAFTIVGLPETEVKESRDRVRAALQNACFEFPARRITVNLAPADLPKESGRFDLPIALGILAASGQMPADQLDEYEYAGELSLSGELRPIRGALAMTFAMQRAGSTRRAFILPRANADEAALVADATVLPADSLLQVCAHFAAGSPDQRLPRHVPQVTLQAHAYPDLADVKGQAHARRALEIAAGGGHSILLIGPPGTGKSMLASRLPGILPPMTDNEALESAALQSLIGSFDPARWKTRPYRTPHHTASAVAMVGGSSSVRPGEISLAHRGVLFLDELPEFERRVLEVLREPLESGCITISRAARQAQFPARFQLVAAMNPCPCGYFGHKAGRCRCTPDMISRYQGRISGPLLDRIDLQVQVGQLDQEELLAPGTGETSLAVRLRVQACAERQMARQGKLNEALAGAELEQECRPAQDADQLLRSAMSRLAWSARAYHRVLKVARTIADMAGVVEIGQPQVAEAIQYRRAIRHD